MRKLIALFLIVVFVVPLALAALTVTSVSTWVLDRNFYTDLLGDSRLYEVLLSEDLPNYFNREVVREADSLPAAALSNALRQVVSPEDLRSQALRLVNNVFDFVEGRSQTLDLYLDLTPIKTALQGPDGQKFAAALAAGLPTCTAGQAAVAPGGTLTRCIPSSMSADQVAGQIAAALPAFLKTVPDQIDLNRYPISWRGETRWANFGFWATGSGGLGVAIFFLAVFAGGMWLTAALVGSENSRERLLWLGWSLIVPAILVFLMGLAISSPFTAGWARFGLNEARFGGFEYSPAFREALLSVTGSALHTIANGFLSVGAVAGAIALALISWGWVSPKQGDWAPAAPPKSSVQDGPSAGSSLPTA